MEVKKNRRIFWNIWLSYASFYFGKVNLSIIIPILLVTYPDLSLYNVGFITSGFMAAYAIGQFLHGQISERFNPYHYIIFGLVGSSIMNLLLGFTGGFFWMLMVAECIDGGFQSMGWSSIVRANTLTSKNPENSSTVLGTAYQVGNSLAWIVCGFMIARFGWQWGFWTGSAVMMIRAVTLYLTKPQIKYKADKLKNRVKVTLGFPIVLSALSLCLLNMVRYGVISWIPTYLFTKQDMPIEKVGLNIFLIPLAGVAGTLLYNKLRLPKDVSSMIYLTGLGVTLLIFPITSGILMIALLIAGGFLLYGPHVFLVTTIPSRYKDKNAVAATTGFIDGWGYVGSVVIGLLVPFILDKTGNWNLIFYFWAVISFVIVALVATIYFREKMRG